MNWTTSPGSCVVALGSEGREDDSVHASRSHGTITHCTALLQGQGQAHHASARFFSVTSSYRFFQEPWYRLTAFPKFAVHHFLSLSVILLLPQAPPEDGECPFAKPAAIKMWQAYCLHCCAIVVPLICISESSGVGRVKEDWEKDEVGWEGAFEVLQVLWSEGEENAGQVGGHKSLWSGQEEDNCRWERWTMILQPCLSFEYMLQSLQSLLLPPRAVTFCILSQNGLQRWVGDREAFSRALSWWQWAFCHFSDSRTGPQCWSVIFPELCIK